MLIISIVLILFLLITLGAYFTNPFSRYSIVRRTFVAKINKKIMQTVDHNDRLSINQAPWYRGFAILKNGIHILSSRYVKSPRSKATSVKEITHDIRAFRFNPDKLLLTTGDHFSALFVRNLGVFYYPTLDRSIKDSEQAWYDRQIVYIQTLAFALGVFAKHRTLTTTIVPTGRYSATCVNFYAYPSDTLYGMLYALSSLLGKASAQPETYAKPHHALYTAEAAQTLFKTYQPALLDLYDGYRKKVFSEASGLIKTDIHLSGAKDITRRYSAFYDNVIFWKTTELAGDMGIIEKDDTFLVTLKKNILKTFWLKEEGYFLEDLSEEGVAKKYYSSDWLIVLATGFLEPSKRSEQHYFERSISYIQKEKIDQPFALKYQQDTRAHRQFFAVRMAVASYGGDAIWSFWGMEYIKSLLLLYKYTKNSQYLKTADYHIAKYKSNMLRDGGFPEVYNNQGDLLETPLYRSVRQAGWVIGFEQVLAMRQIIK